MKDKLYFKREYNDEHSSYSYIDNYKFICRT